MYEFQVKIKVNDEMIWKSVRPSNTEKPYQYTTHKEANDMMNMCYPLCTKDEVRVIKV
jgi:hypothetical protein